MMRLHTGDLLRLELLEERAAGWCFGGQSESSSSQQTSNQDNRAAVGGTGVAATNGANVSQSNESVTSYNLTSLDPQVVAAALSSLDNAVAIAGATQSQAVQSNEHVATTALSTSEQLLVDALGLASKSVDAVQSNAATQATLAQAAVSNASPDTSSLKNVLIAASLVGIAFFLTRGHVI